MIVYLSNCKGRDHIGLFGKDAFYDLDTTGPQATKANNLRVGQQCIVATPADNGQVAFNWYSFSWENIKQDKEGNTYRVFFGKLIKSDTLLKRAAARDGLYSAFFDKNGNFKRGSVFQR